MSDETLLQLSQQLRKTVDALAATVKEAREQVARNKANDEKAHEQFIARQNAQKEMAK